VLGVGLMTAPPDGVAVGPGPPPNKAAATTPTTTSRTITPAMAAITRPRPPPPMPPSPVAPAPVPAAEAAESVVRRSPHWMQKVRPGGLRRPQFQQITSGGRLAKAVPLLCGGEGWAGLGVAGGGAGGVGGGGDPVEASGCPPLTAGTTTVGVSGGKGPGPAPPAAAAAASVGSAGFPVHSRNWPHEPQNSSPGWFWKPQFEQITA
jgi:hypothetical protein